MEPGPCIDQKKKKKEEKTMRTMEKQKKIPNWYKTEDYEYVIFVPTYMYYPNFRTEMKVFEGNQQKWI